MSRPLAQFCLFLAALVTTAGTFWAFQKGANDFNVFYEAWRLVLSGRGAEVYSATPDRFLYAPGFAWLLSPLGLLPRGAALALWCFGKAAVIGLILRELASHLGYRDRLIGLGVASMGLLLVARPLLIDFQYGQVNTFILGACVWGLVSHFAARSSRGWSACAWGVLSIAAFAKLFPLPLLLVPFFVTTGISKEKLRAERLAVLGGLALIVFLPALTQGRAGNLELYFHWKDALVAKGLPTESHNQSFAAFLHHYFGGGLTHVISVGSQHIPLGAAWLSEEKIELLSAGWILLTSGWMLGWILLGPTRSPLAWLAVLIAMLVVPSHLVWKPYFVMGLPVAALACHHAIKRNSRTYVGILALVFLGMNFTGFNFIGSFLAARIEAASIFLLLHLALISLAIVSDRSEASRV